ncbi:hypothetical protein BU14_0277s0002 [Porphyra umbilicalis]|uniref:Uncharacterized protein n=1 Tax=Porphyra umbilicalis TaxID=2786 RepID=A0A1X6P1K8_PORUM|nr:hypothetical protein BU14_0277s0002 [Porphyra umbilicalis]|eukprot:OSX74630.1 hypothetical protein BU14_0277s0002 [Porphyra umbilicalis]
MKDKIEKAPFSADLLRNFRDAAARLDKHLAGYSACVHAAVSRLAPASSPTTSPEHLSKRVHDRLGFLHDHDTHAQRLVNIGLSFAYRHLELDALAIGNVHLLRDIRMKTHVAGSAVLADDVARMTHSHLTAPGGEPSMAVNVDMDGTAAAAAPSDVAREKVRPPGGSAATNVAGLVDRSTAAAATNAETGRGLDCSALVPVPRTVPSPGPPQRRDSCRRSFNGGGAGYL